MCVRYEYSQSQLNATDAERYDVLYDKYDNWLAARYPEDEEYEFTDEEQDEYDALREKMIVAD